jgi:hypothetical protein
VQAAMDDAKAVTHINEGLKDRSREKMKLQADKVSDEERSKRWSISGNICSSCHTIAILAQANGADLEKMSAKGHSFFPIDSINEDFSCGNCHTGAFPKE